MNKCVIILVFLFIVSCSNSENETVLEITRENLVGKWTMVQFGTYDNPTIINQDNRVEPYFLLLAFDDMYVDGGCGIIEITGVFSLIGNNISFFENTLVGESFDFTAEIVELSSNRMIYEFDNGTAHREYQR